MTISEMNLQEMITVKGSVLSKFGSAAKFAESVGWSNRKARDIVSGRQNPTAKDMEVIADALGIRTAEPFCALFFPNLVHKVD